MTAIKVPDELMAKLGAKTQAEFLSAVQALVDKPEPTPAPPAASDNSEVTEALAVLSGQVEELDAAIKAIAAKQTVTAAELANIAKAEASKITSAALSATGTNPAPASVQVDNPANKPTIAADDYKAQWDASEQLRGEFGGDFKTYEAYSKAISTGTVKVYQPKK